MVLIARRPGRSGPDEAAFREFWATAHSPFALLEGWSLALWFPVCPRGLVPTDRSGGVESGPVAVFAWPEAGSPAWTEQPLDTVRRVDGAEVVVVARRDLPPEVIALLDEQLGFRRELPGQVLGNWWVGARPRPRGRPGAALLPTTTNGARGLRSGDTCLVLVDVADRFCVLSDRALRTYIFGDALAKGETPRFVTDHRTWLVDLVPALDPETVGRDYGTEALQRLRPDADAIAVRLREQDDDGEVGGP